MQIVGFVEQDLVNVLPVGRAGVLVIQIQKGIHVEDAHHLFQAFVSPVLTIVQVLGASDDERQHILFHQNPADLAQPHVRFIQIDAGIQVAEINYAVGSGSAFELVQFFTHLVRAGDVPGMVARPAGFMKAENGNMGALKVGHFFAKNTNVFSQGGRTCNTGIQPFVNRGEEKREVHCVKLEK